MLITFNTTLSATASPLYPLSAWKLQVPVDTNGLKIGPSDQIENGAELDGYSSPWFRPDPGFMEFVVDSDGSTTTTATNARCELQEPTYRDHSTPSEMRFEIDVLELTRDSFGATTRAILVQNHNSSDADFTIELRGDDHPATAELLLKYRPQITDPSPHAVTLRTGVTMDASGVYERLSLRVRRRADRVEVFHGANADGAVPDFVTGGPDPQSGAPTPAFQRSGSDQYRWQTGCYFIIDRASALRTCRVRHMPGTDAGPQIIAAGFQPTGVTIGAMTLAGQGGIATSASAITGGDPNGHWQLSGGRVSPSPAGAAAAMNAGPYALRFSGAADMTVSTAPNRRDVASSSELQATYPSATGNGLAGRTVGLRPGTYELGGSPGGFDGTLSDYLTWQGLGTTPDEVRLQNTQSGRKSEIRFNASGNKHLILDTLSIAYEQLGSTIGTGQGNKVGALEVRNGAKFKARNVRVTGDLPAWRQGGVPAQEHAGFYIRQVADVELTDCESSMCVHGFNIDTCNGITLTGCFAHKIWGDAYHLVGNSGSAPARDYRLIACDGTDFWGDYAYLHSDFVQTFNSNLGNANVPWEGLEIAGCMYWPGTESLRTAPTYTNAPVSGGTIRRPQSVASGTFITSNTTLSSSDTNLTWQVIATGSEVVVTLPSAGSVSSNHHMVILRVGPGASTAPVRIRTSGSDRIDGSSADIVLTDNTANCVNIRRTSSSGWTRMVDGPTVQGFLIQDLGTSNPVPRFQDLRVHGNVLYCSNTNAGTLGNQTRSEVQKGRFWNNSYVEIFPGDTNGDGVIDGFDGQARGTLEVDITGTDDAISFRDVCALFNSRGVGNPKVVENATYTTHNNASQANLYANQSGSAPVAPVTRDEAVFLARPAPGGNLDLGGGAWVGALGPSDGAGYWDPAARRTNAAAATPPRIVSTSPSDNASGVNTGAAIYITFDQPIDFGTGVIRLRRGGSTVETFDVVSDSENGPDAGGAGTNGRVHLEGNVLVVNPSAMSGGSTHALRIDPGAIRGVLGADFAGIGNDTDLSWTTS